MNDCIAAVTFYISLAKIGTASILFVLIATGCL